MFSLLFCNSIQCSLYLHYLSIEIKNDTYYVIISIWTFLFDFKNDHDLLDSLLPSYTHPHPQDSF